jgi:hypothetical protein
MPVNPVTGERLPYPGEPGYTGVVPPNTGPGIEATNQAMGLGGPPMAGPEMPQPVGQEGRLAQLLEARQMIDQEIAAIVGAPVDAGNLDMLPPPPIDPMMAQMPPEAMGAINGVGGPPMAPPMPPMGPQGLLGA